MHAPAHDLEIDPDVLRRLHSGGAEGTGKIAGEDQGRQANAGKSAQALNRNGELTDSLSCPLTSWSTGSSPGA